MVKTSLAVIGSRHYKSSTVKSLIEEGKKLFDRVTFVPIDRIKAVFEKNQARLLFKEKDILGYDVCYPRLSSRDYVMGEVVLKVLDESNIYCPVNLRAYQVANHKYYTIKELSNAKVPIVKSSLFISPASARQTLREFGMPFVVKLLSGFAGKGVILVENEKQLNSILDTVHLFDEFISAQKFVKGKNSDIRCYVVGEKVIAVKRIGTQGEWRANISRGGTAEEITPTKEMQRIALAAARLFKMDICAVDLIESERGLAVIEVNFMPGPFKKYLGNLVTKEMIGFLHGKAVERKNEHGPQKVKRL
jgi:ribosomal protein S6--L-glutamate ligase